MGYFDRLSCFINKYICAGLFLYQSKYRRMNFFNEQEGHDGPEVTHLSHPDCVV